MATRKRAKGQTTIYLKQYYVAQIGLLVQRLISIKTILENERTRRTSSI
jgi:hypothetical protein